MQAYYFLETNCFDDGNHPRHPTVSFIVTLFNDATKLTDFSGYVVPM